MLQNVSFVSGFWIQFCLQRVHVDVERVQRIPIQKVAVLQHCMVSTVVSLGIVKNILTVKLLQKLSLILGIIQWKPPPAPAQDICTASAQDICSTQFPLSTDVSPRYKPVTLINRTIGHDLSWAVPREKSINHKWTMKRFVDICWNRAILLLAINDPSKYPPTGNHLSGIFDSSFKI
jgi:hypothetical protein